MGRYKVTPRTAGNAVNVRDAPGGDVVGTVVDGDVVEGTVEGDWVKTEGGYIVRELLVNVPAPRKTAARKPAARKTAAMKGTAK